MRGSRCAISRSGVGTRPNSRSPILKNIRVSTPGRMTSAIRSIEVPLFRSPSLTAPLPSRAAKRRFVPLARRPWRSIRNPAASTALSGVTVRVTSTRRPRPYRLDHVLHAGAPWNGRPYVLQHAKLAGRPEHALDLCEPASRIVHAAEDEPTQDRVERRGPEGQLLHAADDERNSRGAPSGPLKRLQRGVQGDGLRPRGRRDRFRPVPEPRSSTAPSAPATSKRRHFARPPHSHSEQRISWSHGICSMPRTT